MIGLVKTHIRAILPEKKSVFASGFDVHSVEHVYLYPNFPTIIQSGLRLAYCPDNIEIQVRQRSGLASKGVIVANAPGTIDSDYRGEIGIILLYLGKDLNYEIKIGDRIAQLVPSLKADEQFMFTDNINETERGSAGFGSTGR